MRSACVHARVRLRYASRRRTLRTSARSPPDLDGQSSTARAPAQKGKLVGRIWPDAVGPGPGAFNPAAAMISADVGNSPRLERRTSVVPTLAEHPAPTSEIGKSGS